MGCSHRSCERSSVTGGAWRNPGTGFFPATSKGGTSAKTPSKTAFPLPGSQPVPPLQRSLLDALRGKAPGVLKLVGFGQENLARFRSHSTRRNS